MTETTKPTLAILGGTGKEGPGLALRWAKQGYKILIGSRKADKAQATAAELNEKLGIDTIEGDTNDAVARRADISVLTVVQWAHEDTVTGLKDALQGKILVDATARVEFKDPKPPTQPSAARRAQTILGDGVRVAGAFQNTPAHSLKKNLGGDLDIDVLVCADDMDAAEQTIALVQAAGMRGYYAGNLDNAIVMEGLTAILIALNKHHKTRTASIRIAGL
jgi:hypothetical protein